MSKMLENLKIVIDNELNNVQDDEMIEIDQNDDLNTISHTNLILNNNINQAIISNNDENETEFHVNLDTVPSTLKNTVLCEKIYLNESLKEEDDFPLKPENLDHISEENLKELYESLGLSEVDFVKPNESISNHPLQTDENLYRREALHIFGVDELSTDDIFDYFKKYKPYAVEWINDSSCNVLWKNENHAANAMFKMSVPYDEERHNELAGKGERKPPAGSKWRLSAKSAKGYHIYMRYVRKTDRKKKGAESKSKYYVKYGNPNYNNITGLISGSKRREMRVKQLKEANADLLDDENGQDEEGSDGRKLVSYNIDDERDINDLEEFGTSSQVTKRENIRTNLEKRDRSRSPIVKSAKKMHLYSDELEEEGLKNKRRQRFGIDESKSNDYNRNIPARDRYSKNYNDRSERRYRSHMDEEDDQRRQRHSNHRDLKSRLGGREFNGNGFRRY